MQGLDAHTGDMDGGGRNTKLCRRFVRVLLTESAKASSVRLSRRPLSAAHRIGDVDPREAFLDPKEDTGDTRRRQLTPDRSRGRGFIAAPATPDRSRGGHDLISSFLAALLRSQVLSLQGESHEGTHQLGGVGVRGGLTF